MSEPEEFVENAGIVMDWFGYWPSFHDDHIEYAHFGTDRSKLEQEDFENGSFLKVGIRSRRWTGKITDRGSPVFDKHCIVELGFYGIHSVKLRGFPEWAPSF